MNERREQMEKLLDRARQAFNDAATNGTDGAWLLACNSINSAAAELTKLSRAEACRIIDAKMNA